MQHYQLAALIQEALIKSNERDIVTYNKEALMAMSYMNDVEVAFVCGINDSPVSDIYQGLRFTIDNKIKDFDWYEWMIEDDDYGMENAWDAFINKCEKFYCMIAPSLPIKRQRMVMPKRVIYEFE